MTDETVRYTMRTAAVQDGIYMRAKCLVHSDCRVHGRMCFPSGRRVKLYTKTGDVKDLNANFVSHLEKRDLVDGTSHADTWRKGLIHGPRAPFVVPYDGEARAAEVREDHADMEVDAVPDPQRDTVIALAAARVTATAVANVLAAARARAAAEAVPAPAPAVTAPLDGRCRKSEMCDNVHNHRGRCNQKRKRSVVTNP